MSDKRFGWRQVSWVTGAAASLIGFWLVVHAAEMIYQSGGLAVAHWLPLPWALLPLFSLLGILLDRTTVRLTPVLLLLAGSAAFVTQVGSGFLRDTLLFLLVLTCHEVARLRTGAGVAIVTPVRS